ncbi:hypothetical protein DCC79_05090 [bacterium]|nr:MAG: hypothetical protein DCC79_05090 [bacterium]
MSPTLIPTPFPLARVRFKLVAREPMDLPAYKGAVLRGGFGVALKARACQRPPPDACTPCRMGNACTYGYAFETSPPPTGGVFRNLSDVPTPLVFDPPLVPQTAYAPGETLSFDMLLVGRGIGELTHYVRAFDDLGEMGLGVRRARFDVARVLSMNLWGREAALLRDGAGDGRPVAADRRVIADADAIVARAETMPRERLTLRFLTPTRIKHAKAFVGDPDGPVPELEFHMLVRALLRRVSALASCHCGADWQVDFRGVIAAAERVRLVQSSLLWVDERRYSTRQHQDMHLGGLVDTVTYEGDLAMFRPLLAAGEQVHVGKAAVFGNGRFVVGD